MPVELLVAFHPRVPATNSSLPQSSCVGAEGRSPNASGTTGDCCSRSIAPAWCSTANDRFLLQNDAPDQLRHRDQAIRQVTFTAGDEYVAWRSPQLAASATADSGRSASPDHGPRVASGTTPTARVRDSTPAAGTARREPTRCSARRPSWTCRPRPRHAGRVRRVRGIDHSGAREGRSRSSSSEGYDARTAQNRCHDRGPHSRLGRPRLWQSENRKNAWGRC